MSRIEVAEGLEKTEKLFRFAPKLRAAEQEVRRMSLSPHIHQWLHGRGSVELKAGVRSHFGSFVKGEYIDDLYYMKRVEYRSEYQSSFDDHIWSVRPTALPYQRFFGAFISSDWLVILNMRARDDLEYSDETWNRQVNKTRLAWDNVLPGVPRHFGSNFQDYVTFNSEHLDDRWDES